MRGAAVAILLARFPAVNASLHASYDPFYDRDPFYPLGPLLDDFSSDEWVLRHNEQMRRADALRQRALFAVDRARARTRSLQLAGRHTAAARAAMRVRATVRRALGVPRARVTPAP